MSLINIKQSTLVQPCDPTPLKTLELSKLDIIIRVPKTHTNIFYIYDRPSLIKSPATFSAEILKNALSKILVPYYPLAGRLREIENDIGYEIDCNAKGALFVEAKTKYTIDEFNEFEPSAILRELMIPKCDYTTDLSLIPLLMVQVTWFKCGGVGLGFAPHHHIADGAAHIDFFAKLVRLADGFDPTIKPVFDRIHVAGRDQRQVKFQHLYEFEPILPCLPSNGFIGDQNETTQALFKFSKDQILAIKQLALSRNYPKISTYVAVAAHIWRSTCKARALPYDLEVKLYIPIDGRSRLSDPIIPQGYFGNVLFFAICALKVGDIVHKPLWYVASKIQEATQMRNNEYLRSSIDFLDLQNGPLDPLMGAHKILYPNLLINSWVKLPFYESDFGWGPPKIVGNCEIKLEGLSFLSSGSIEDESLSLAINLFSAHMPLFKKHLYNITPTHIYSSL